jgi:pyrroline-5-carboxylate reductase
MTYELGIVGAGNMAEAIVRGVLRAAQLQPAQIIAADVSPQRRELFERELKIKTVDAVRDAAGQSRIVLLSVKPQQCQAVLGEIGPSVAANALVISIMAGISSKFIEMALGGSHPRRVVRTMPNTPMLVGEGMAAICRGKHATAEDIATTRRLFESAASVVEITEDKMDAVTAISGSGPAYFFFLVEQMIRAGTELGLTPEQAHSLATRTAMGAAKMLVTSKDMPADLRKKVTSPGGTTQAAIEHMQGKHLDDIISGAIAAAAKRSKELGV